MEREPDRAVGGRSDLPQIDLVVGKVVIVPALRGRPDQPLPVCRELREVLMRAPAGKVDQRDGIQIGIALARLAVGDRQVEHAAAAVAAGMHPVDFVTRWRPVDLAALAGTGPGLVLEIPDPGFPLGPAQCDGEVSTILRQFGLLQQRSVEVRHLSAVDQHALLATGERATVHRGRAHIDDLVAGDPAAPARVVHDLGFFLAVWSDGEDVPLAIRVRVPFIDPTLLAAREENARAVRRKAWEPVDRVTLGDGVNVRAIGVHYEEVVVAEARTGPDNLSIRLATDRGHRLFLGRAGLFLTAARPAGHGGAPGDHRGQRSKRPAAAEPRCAGTACIRWIAMSHQLTHAVLLSAGRRPHWSPLCLLLSS